MVTLSSQSICAVNLHWGTRFKIYAFADGLDSGLRSVFRDAESLLAGAELIKNSRSTAAGIFVLNGKKYFIKRSNVKGFSGSLRRLFRMSRAQRNFLAAEKLQLLNIRTPQVYMALTTSPFGLPGAGYLITESFPAPMHLTGRLKEVLESGLNLDDLIAELTRMLLRLHEAGMVHGDAKTSNILAVCEAGKWQFGLFDLDSMLWNCRSIYRFRAEMARLASSIYIALKEKNLADSISYECIGTAVAGAYSAAGGKDFSGDKRYWRRIREFLLSAKVI